MAAIRSASALAAFACLLFAAVGDALAEDYAAAQGYLHSFNNGITVYTGVFSLNKDLSLTTSFNLKYQVDMIDAGHGEGGDDDDDDDDDDDHALSSPVAAVSGASSAVSSGDDTRHEILAGFSHNFENIVIVEASYDYSSEKDYLSKTPMVTVKKELFEKNTTLTLGYSRNDDTISGQFLATEGERSTDNFYAGITQVISPVTIAQAGYSRSSAEGLMSEGIRLVAIDGQDPAACTEETATCVDELFPDTRTRNAYIVGMNHYFVEEKGFPLGRSAIRLQARYYDDSWDVNSYTGDIEWSKYLSDAFLVRLGYRYYTQSKAFFVKGDTEYTSADEFRSASPQLLEKNTNLYGLKLVYRFKGRANAFIDSGALEGKYEYYRESTGVNANIFMAGLRMSF